MLHTHTHTHTHTHSRRQTHHSHTVRHTHTVKTHTANSPPKKKKKKENVQSKQTRGGLTANCRDNTNWFDPSLLLGKEICATHTHTHTHTQHMKTYVPQQQHYEEL